MDINAFSGIVFGYVIAQIFLVKYLGRETMDWCGCLITMAIVISLHLLIGETENYAEIIEGCVVGQLTTKMLLRGK